MGCGSSSLSRDPWTLAAEGSIAALAQWIDAGGSVGAVDTAKGRGTLLHAAARADQVECIKLLLKCGAHVDQTTPELGSPLHVAAAAGAGNAVTVLLANGASTSLRLGGATAAELAQRQGYPATAGLIRMTQETPPPPPPHPATDLFVTLDTPPAPHEAAVDALISPTLDISPPTEHELVAAGDASEHAAAAEAQLRSEVPQVSQGEVPLQGAMEPQEAVSAVVAASEPAADGPPPGAASGPAEPPAHKVGPAFELSRSLSRQLLWAGPDVVSPTGASIKQQQQQQQQLAVAALDAEPAALTPLAPPTPPGIGKLGVRPRSHAAPRKALPPSPGAMAALAASTAGSRGWLEGGASIGAQLWAQRAM